MSGRGPRNGTVWFWARVALVALVVAWDLQMGDAVIRLILLVFALVCFILAAFPLAQPYHPRLIAAGLAFLTASMIPWPVA